jgi:hypothetical protein
MTHNSEASPLKITLELQEVWRAFDALPKIIRDEIAHAAFEYDTIAILADYRAHKADWLRDISDYEYLQIMKDNFRRDLYAHSMTRTENGTYRLAKRKVSKLHGRQESERKDFQTYQPRHPR